jgi:glycerol-3-phosphate dehydrogenase
LIDGFFGLDPLLSPGHQTILRLKIFMVEFSRHTRREVFEKFERETFDLLVIGGGVTGAGVALDAASRGLKTALVEKRDFAAGTSSRTTKLIHGGLRYLEQYDFGLVREALAEREILTRTAPHLVEAFPFVIPIYENSKRNYDHPLKMRVGLAFYDLLAGRSEFKRHRRLSREQALELAPGLDPKGLKGAFVYYDARTDDARLVIDIIKTAHERGVVVANHVLVTGFRKSNQGQGHGLIDGVRCRDGLSGREFDARARSVVNATGVWTEDTFDLSQNGGRLPKSIRPAKGVHLTIPAERLPVQSAWLIPALTGHRFYFVVPWRGRVNIGTTDTDYEGDKESPSVTPAEVDEILTAVNVYFPEAKLEVSDVISAWAGLRPLISDRSAKKTNQISRKEELIETDDGLLSISGGKLTTYRHMAETTVDLAVRRLRERHGVNPGRSTTKQIQLSGGNIRRDELGTIAARIAGTEKLPLAAALHLVDCYGSEYSRLIELMRGDERLRRSLVEGLPHLAVEIVYAARFEMAATLADVLTRRVRLAMLAGKKSLECAPLVAELMAEELGWSETEIEQQIQMFFAEFSEEYAVPTR